MAHLIDKDALVAEIERRISNLHEAGDDDYLYIHFEEQYGCIIAYKSILSLLDTLEVKEVDLQKDSLTWKDINLIDHLLFDIKEDYENGKLDKEEYYKEVLKKFKEQL